MTQEVEVSVPAELKYTKEHEWIKIDGSIATVGLTDYAQGELGDIVFVELAQVGDDVKREGVFGTIEAVKAVSDMFAPVSGKVIEINAALEDDPMVVNQDPYGGGWMIKLEVTDPGELDQLLSAADYEKIIG